MKIGICTEDDKHWNLTERFFKKKFKKKNYGTLKIQNFLNFLLKKRSSAFVQIQRQMLKKALC